MIRVSLKLENPLPLADNLTFAREAETAGLAGVWVSEYNRHDAVSQLAALACATDQIALGSSIVPIYTRSATVLGMTAMTLAELSRGRVCIGLGTSTDTIVRGWHGTARYKPLQAVREHVEILRATSRGERLHHRGDVASADGFRYQGTAAEVSIGLAALGPRMLRLAGELADVVLLNFVPADAVARAIKDVGLGAEAAGRPGPRLAMDLRVALCDDAKLAKQRQKMRKLLASYGRVAAYNAHFARVGFEAQATALAHAWAAGDARGALDAVDDGMVDALTAFGRPERVRDRIVEYRDAGLDEVILYPTPIVGDERNTISEILEFAGSVSTELAGDPAR